MRLYDIELEPEVERWLESLSDDQYGRVEAFAGLLAEHAETLGEPYSRHLGDGLRELRIPLHPIEARITYWLAPGRRVILLTVFRKTRQRQMDEVERAKGAKKECEANHSHAEQVFERELGR